MKIRTISHYSNLETYICIGLMAAIEISQEEADTLKKIADSTALACKIFSYYPSRKILGNPTGFAIQ